MIAIACAVLKCSPPPRVRSNRLEPKMMRAASSSSELKNVLEPGLMHVVIMCMLTGGDGGVGNHSSDPNPPPLRYRRLGYFLVTIRGGADV